MKPFDWLDGDRSVHFGRGRIDEAVELARGPHYLLLTTDRAAAQAPNVVEAAAEVLHVPGGKVDEVAAALLAEGPLSAAVLPSHVDRTRIVALGGGRVVDVAKAVAAAHGNEELELVVAIPTTLSGAEMTRSHRHARDVAAGTRHVRPGIVINDPALAASQPVAELAASALNALGHAVEGPLTPKANPVATLAAREAARLLVNAFFEDDPDRDALALGALLAGYAIDSQGYGLHHVMSQTIVRTAGIPHGTGNAILLPHTAWALRERFPAEIAALDAVLGQPVEDAAEHLLGLTGTTTLRAAGLDAETIERAADEAVKRPDLAQTPPAADRDELLAIYTAALG